MVKPSPNMVEEETNAAIMLIKEKVRALKYFKQSSRLREDAVMVCDVIL